MASEKKEKLEGGFTANLKLVFVASANHASRSAQIKAVDMVRPLVLEIRKPDADGEVDGRDAARGYRSWCEFPEWPLE